MKLTNLIDRCRDALAEHGDLDVFVEFIDNNAIHDTVKATTTMMNVDDETGAVKGFMIAGFLD